MPPFLYLSYHSSAIEKNAQSELGSTADLRIGILFSLFSPQTTYSLPLIRQALPAAWAYAIRPYEKNTQAEAYGYIGQIRELKSAATKMAPLNSVAN